MPQQKKNNNNKIKINLKWIVENHVLKGDTLRFGFGVINRSLVKFFQQQQQWQGENGKKKAKNIVMTFLLSLVGRGNGQMWKVARMMVGKERLKWKLYFKCLKGPKSVGSIKRGDDTWANSGLGTLDFLSRTHFPGCKDTSSGEQSQTPSLHYTAKDERPLGRITS